MPEGSLTADEMALQSKLKSLQLPDKSRPDFGLCAVTGRKTETVFAADAPNTSNEAAALSSLCTQRGIKRALILDSQTGKIGGLFSGLELVTTLLDPAETGACGAAHSVFKDAKVAREKLVVVGPAAADRATALVLGAYIMAEYDATAAEASDILKARQKHSGVKGRVPEEADLDLFAQAGSVDLGAAPPPPPKPLPPLKSEAPSNPFSDGPKSPGGLFL